MKKIYLALPLLALAMTACDPSEFDLGSPDADTSTATLESAITINQVDENGNPAADGNYFTYTTSPALPVQIYNYNADGKEVSLAHGAHGSFSIIPKRGQDPAQTFYVRLANHDGSMTELSKTYNVYVPTELSKGVKLVASNSGSKVWKWNTEAPDGVVWGNMGYCGGAGEAVFNGTAGAKWWGVTSEEEFLTQGDHTGADGFLGDESMDAWMVFNEDGSIKTYAADGKLIREGSYSVENFDDSDPSAWKVGDLATSAGAIMWPYEINSGGNKPTTFEIVYLTPAYMTLVYPDGGAFDGLGNWGEATFWQFKSTSDTEGILAGNNEGNAWTWNTDAPDGVIWGNMGYCGGSGEAVFNGTAGAKWWGVTSEEEFGGQLKHSAVGELTGEESLDAYMVFKEDGSLKKYDANGKLLNDGTYSIENITGNDWKVAELTTSDGAILWPYQINWADNGFSPYPEKYEVVYLSADKMTLVYPDGGAFDGLGNWGEATFWQFKRK